MKEYGRAMIKGKKIYFNAVGWDMIKQVAKQKHQSPRTIVMAALKRGIKVEKAKAKSI